MKKITSIFGILLLVAGMSFTCAATPDNKISLFDDNPVSYVQSDINVVVFYAVESSEVIFGEPSFAYLTVTPLSSLSPSVGIAPDPVIVPKGTITYLKTLKPLYRQPFVDNRYVWELQHQYNC